MRLRPPTQRPKPPGQTPLPPDDEIIPHERARQKVALLIYPKIQPSFSVSPYFFRVTPLLRYSLNLSYVLDLASTNLLIMSGNPAGFDFASLTPEQQQQARLLPALEPPDGITPILNNPPNENVYGYFTLSLCLSVATIALFARLYTRVFIVRQHFLGDCGFSGFTQHIQELTT